MKIWHIKCDHSLKGVLDTDHWLHPWHGLLGTMSWKKLTRQDTYAWADPEGGVSGMDVAMTKT